MASQPISPAPEAAPPRFYPGWLVVLAAFFGVMAGFGSTVVFTFGVFLKPLTAEFGWGREQVSTAFGIAAMSVAVASPMLGKLLDRYGPRRLILPCMAVFGLAFASLSQLTPSLIHFYAAFLIIGIVGNGTTQMGYSRAVSSWFTAKRGLALALVLAGSGIGSIMFPGLAQRIIDTQGWRTAYLLLGGLVLLFGIPLTALFVREKPAAPHHASPASAGVSVAQGLRSRAFWILVAILFLSSISINGSITHMAALLTDRGLPAASGAMALSALGAMSLVGRLITGHLLDRYFGPWVSFALLVGAAAGVALLSVATSQSTAFVAAGLIGLGLGGEADVTPYLLTRYFGLRRFSTLYGFTWTAFAFAGAVGPVVMGRVFDATGSYGPLLMLLAAQTLFAAILALLLPRYPAREGVSYA